MNSWKLAKRNYSQRAIVEYTIKLVVFFVLQALPCSSSAIDEIHADPGWQYSVNLPESSITENGFEIRSDNAILLGNADSFALRIHLNLEITPSSGSITTMPGLMYFHSLSCPGLVVTPTAYHFIVVDSQGTKLREYSDYKQGEDYIDATKLQQEIVLQKGDIMRVYYTTHFHCYDNSLIPMGNTQDFWIDLSNISIQRILAFMCKYPP